MHLFLLKALQSKVQFKATTIIKLFINKKHLETERIKMIRSWREIENRYKV